MQKKGNTEEINEVENKNNIRKSMKQKDGFCEENFKTDKLPTEMGEDTKYSYCE